MKELIIDKISGKGMPLKGNDIDTDRIMPARFLKELTFNNLGKYVFNDDRAELQAEGKLHAFDNPIFQDAKFLIVNSNFGCGSSREHAPQGIKRSGIDCVIGESFSEIFYSNCCAIGMPCLRVSKDTAEKLQELAANPETEFELCLSDQTLKAAGDLFEFEIKESLRKSFSEGTWDITSELLEAKDAIDSVHSSLHYPKFT